MQERKLKVLEVSGRDVDEAIANGLAQLGMSRDEVLIEVLSRGKRGLLGLGAEPARVRILYPAEESEEEVLPQIAEGELPPSPDREVAQIAQAVVRELLERMGVQAQVTVHEPGENEILTLDITGEDLSILIGPKGKILNALQYIARLIVSRELLRRATFFLDVEGFRQRRARELEDLARRTAERVAFSKQPLALEPMPAHERRIIHLALHDHPLVTTHSVGRGERRRVTILPRE